MLKLAKNSSFVIFIALLKCIGDIKILSKCSVESKVVAAVSQSVCLFIPSVGVQTTKDLTAKLYWYLQRKAEDTTDRNSEILFSIFLTTFSVIFNIRKHLS